MKEDDDDNDVTSDSEIILKYRLHCKLIGNKVITSQTVCKMIDLYQGWQTCYCG